MPYGVDKSLGGDSEENTKWMDDCVTTLKKQGKEEGSAIAICKVTMRKHKENMKKKGDMTKSNDVASNTSITFHIDDL